MSGQYILNDNGEPEEVVVWKHGVLDMKALTRWAKFMEGDPKRRWVARDTIGPYLVSTVFLALDHRFVDDGPPILWETMVFDQRTQEARGIGMDLEQVRYSSKADALRGHAHMCDLVRMALKLEDQAAATEPDHIREDSGK